MHELRARHFKGLNEPSCNPVPCNNTQLLQSVPFFFFFFSVFCCCLLCFVSFLFMQSGRDTRLIHAARSSVPMKTVYGRNRTCLPFPCLVLLIMLFFKMQLRHSSSLLMDHDHEVIGKYMMLCNSTTRHQDKSAIKITSFLTFFVCFT